MTEERYCEAPECEEPASGHGAYCAYHLKRAQRGKSLSAPKTERLPVEKRLHEAVLSLADFDSEDDEAYYAKWRHVLSLSRQVGAKERNKRIQQGLAAARARGVRLGRPPKLTAEMASELLREAGSIRRAAAILRVDRKTVRSALNGGEKTKITPHRATGCPRTNGGSA